MDALELERGTARKARSAGLTLRVLAALGVALGGGAIPHRLTQTAVGGDGSLTWLVTVAASAVVAIVLVAAVVSPLVRSQAELEVRYAAALADALRDPLTGLGNHRAFQEELDRQVAASVRYGTPLALVLIDLDEFKSVNDKDGHAAGDLVLHGFGQLLAGGLRRADRPFRVGGDEFAALLPHTDADGARVVARRLLATALQPPLRHESPRISFSAGISAIPDLADARSQLYSQADAALYAAKRGGRTDIHIFDPAVAVIQTDETASAAVAEVIARAQLRAVYQPIVELMGGAVLGVEGLIRPTGDTPFTDPAGLFAADEIGAGNAGLRLLAEIRFDVLKVDLSLVQRSAPGAPSSAVVSSVIELAARTRALVVAEGVEDEAEPARLAALGVPAAQGYYFGRPGPLIAADAPEPEVPGTVGAWRRSMGLPTAARS